MVVTADPSAWAANIVHDFTDSPSSSTVHAPHDDVSQPTFVPLSPSASRTKCTRRVRASTPCSVAEPLTVTRTTSSVAASAVIGGLAKGGPAGAGGGGAPRAPRPRR